MKSLFPIREGRDGVEGNNPQIVEIKDVKSTFLDILRTNL